MRAYSALLKSKKLLFCVPFFVIYLYNFISLFFLIWLAFSFAIYPSTYDFFNYILPMVIIINFFSPNIWLFFVKFSWLNVPFLQYCRSQRAMENYESNQMFEKSISLTLNANHPTFSNSISLFRLNVQKKKHPWNA